MSAFYRHLFEIILLAGDQLTHPEVSAAFWFRGEVTAKSMKSESDRIVSIVTTALVNTLQLVIPLLLVN